jgi:serine/threonine protein kinase
MGETAAASQPDDHGQGLDTRIGATPGTLKYMSPDQARGEELDARTDVFSLGLVLYEMIAGRHPYDDLTDEQSVDALKSGDEILPISSCARSIPAALVRIISRSLRKKPADRYASAAEMLADLTDVKSLIEVSRQEQGQQLFRVRNANQQLTQYAVLYDVDKRTRIPLNTLWTIWRYADLKRAHSKLKLSAKVSSAAFSKLAC